MQRFVFVPGEHVEARIDRSRRPLGKRLLKSCIRSRPAPLPSLPTGGGLELRSGARWGGSATFRLRVDHCWRAHAHKFGKVFRKCALSEARIAVPGRSTEKQTGVFFSFIDLSGRLRRPFLFWGIGGSGRRPVESADPPDPACGAASELGVLAGWGLRKEWLKSMV